MKKTLYEILGVDPTASKEQIEQAYIARVDELKFATLQDPNKLRVLQSSKEILTDPNQRATYDASLVRAESQTKSPNSPPPAAEEPSFLQQWGKWIAIAVVAVVAVVFLTRHHAEQPLQQAQAVKPVAVPIAQAVPQPKPATEAAPAAQASATVTAPPAQVQTAADAAAEPLLGDWNCTDAISGRTSKYTFRPGGVLAIASTDGPAEYKFEFSGKTLTLTDASKVSTLTAEELAARKMILNTGADGRRIVCKR